MAVGGLTSRQHGEQLELNQATEGGDAGHHSPHRPSAQANWEIRCFGKSLWSSSSPLGCLVGLRRGQGRGVAGEAAGRGDHDVMIIALPPCDRRRLCCRGVKGPKSSVAWVTAWLSPAVSMPPDNLCTMAVWFVGEGPHLLRPLLGLPLRSKDREWGWWMSTVWRCAALRWMVRCARARQVCYHRPQCCGCGLSCGGGGLRCVHSRSLRRRRSFLAGRSPARRSNKDQGAFKP
jgi:hypothetical protein